MFVEEVFAYNIKDKVTDAIVNNKRGFLYFIPQKTSVFVGYGNTINQKQSQNYEIEVFDLNNEGGVIVSDKGSLIIGSFFENTLDFQKELSIEICKLLHSKGYNPSVINNDILVDGKYKVASYSSRRFGEAYFGAFQISFSVNMDLIKALCTKKMVKIPKGINDFGVTFDEVFKIFNKTKNNFTKLY